MALSREISVALSVWRGWNAKKIYFLKGGTSKEVKEQVCTWVDFSYPFKRALGFWTAQLHTTKVLELSKVFEVYKKSLGTKDCILWASHWSRQN